MAGEPERIDAKARSLRELLQNRRYGLDFYQREYRWGERQIAELLEDLTKRFLGDYQEAHSRKDVANYSPYFLGSIVVSQRGDTRYLIDGQQRLTSLTLLLIHLHHSLEIAEAAQIAPLISSVHYGEHSFNLDVPERTACMAALFERESYDGVDQTESVANIIARFREIQEWWSSDDLDARVLPFFADWLVEKLVLVEIVTSDDDMAYEIFETMNDRGLSLKRDCSSGRPMARRDSAAYRTRQGGRLRLLQVVAAGQLCGFNPRPQARRRSPGLRPRRYTIPPLGP
jgi:hypothetical protein